MRYQSREFHKFFWGTNCCSYNTRGFHEIFAFRIFAKFSHFAMFSFNFFSRKNAEFGEKVCEMRPKIFAFFRETFRSLETLLVGNIYSPNSAPYANRSLPRYASWNSFLLLITLPTRIAESLATCYRSYC